MITEKSYTDCAFSINVSVAAIKAVADVESNGGGFLEDGKTPKILFEPHIFWKQLLKAGIDPLPYSKESKYSDILYPVWGTKPYGKSSEQHERLQRAVTINRKAALQSASWGKFQIMAFNYKICRFDTLQAFINCMYENEDCHLKAFINYIETQHLDDELRLLADPMLRISAAQQFARQYNGPLYAKNNYDTRLVSAFVKYANPN